MSKKIALLSLYDNTNYWNKLQNYAVQEIIKRHVDWKIITIKNYNKIDIWMNIKLWIYDFFKECKNTSIFNAFFHFIKKPFILIIRIVKNNYTKHNKDPFLEQQLINRMNSFIKFDNLIRKSDFIVNAYKPNTKLLEWFDYYIVGSDQVWNPRGVWIMPLFTLWYIKDNNKKISFSASFAVNSLPEWNKKGMKEISKFKSISVREIRGKEIIEEYTKRKDIQVLLDPSMLLPIESRNKISTYPKLFSEIWFKKNKYIFCYFLWNIDEKTKSEIERIARENECKITYIMDKNDPFFTSWPSEFIWLIKNAYLICTDSFHGSAFSLLYNKPFVVFNRIDPGQKEWEKNSMNSRITTLLEKFQINNRYFNGKIDNELLIPNYPQFETILNQEKLKADKFLKQAFSE